MIAEINQIPEFYVLHDIEHVEELNDAEHVYDIEVDDIHCFTAKNPDSGLESVSHNSATICIFSKHDKEMISAKTGNWFTENPQRARSNNSVLLLRSETSKEEFDSIIESTKQFGEPGFFWSDSTEMLCNPCFVAETWIMTKDGPRMIEDLIKTPFEAYVNGKLYKSETGFVKTGNKPIFKVNTKEGFEVECTDNHKFLVNTNTGNEWKELKNINIGEHILVHDHKQLSWQGDGGNFELGFNTKDDNGIEFKSSEYYIGFFASLFTKSGIVRDKKTTPIVYIPHLEKNKLQMFQRMLLRLGVYSEIIKYRHKFTRIVGSMFLRRPYLALKIEGIMANKFATLMGSNYVHPKISKLINICGKYTFNNDYIISATVESIENTNTNCDVYDCTVNDVHAFDANGFYAHNCVEIGLYCYDEFGNSGWQFCNLSTINGSKIKSKSDFMRAARSATIIGTLQAGYTSFPYLGEVTERITRKESLLGVSITGLMENSKVLLNPEIQKEIAESLPDLNKEIAKILGINPAARICCVKPEGSSSCMLGTLSGITPGKSQRYIRRVQANKSEAPVQLYKQINPRSVEESSWSANKTDYCISFACELIKPDVIFEKDISAVDHLKLIKSTQENWVESGMDKSLCAQSYLTHNVSNTVVVKPNEWKDVADFIFENRDKFAGVSLIASTGDKDYTQAPFTEVFTPEQIVQIYGEGSLFASGIIEECMDVYGDVWKACDQVLGFGENLDEKKILEHEEHKRKQKIALIERIKKFSKKYYGNNHSKVTYLLKDVYNWKLWLDIVKEHKKVNYLEMVEEENTTTGTKEIACAGGACMI